MNTSPDQIIKTDVLILGGGAAGLRAAIEAHHAGVDVCILSAFKAGFGNNTAISLGGFSAASATLDRDDSPRAHYEDTVRGGCGINRSFLVRLLTEKVWSEVNALESMGVGFLKDSAGKYLRVARGGHSQARRLATPGNTGMNFVLPLLKYKKGLTVKQVDGLKAVNLLTFENRICGALLIDRKGTWFAAEAGAVILATGGGGAIYPRTSNVPSATGDGYALAYRAGLSVQDMEFVQFVVRNQKEPGVPKRLPPCEFLLLKGAVLRNTRGENLFDVQGKQPVYTRDAIAQTVARGIAHDENPEDFVYLDTGGMDPKELSQLKIDPGKLIKINPASHFFMGGVRVKKDLSTTVEGLYAAGEVMGGVHGANRLAGNALAETFTFGALTGSCAARFVKASAAASPYQANLANRAKQELIGRFKGTGEAALLRNRISEIDTELKELMNQSAGIIRDYDSLEQGIQGLNILKEELTLLPLPPAGDLWRMLTLDNKMIVCEMILNSAMEREESRGAHYRDDFPDRNDERFVVNICVSQGENGRMRLSRLPVTDDN